MDDNVLMIVVVVVCYLLLVASAILFVISMSKFLSFLKKKDNTNEKLYNLTHFRIYDEDGMYFCALYGLSFAAAALIIGVIFSIPSIGTSEGHISGYHVLIIALVGIFLSVTNGLLNEVYGHLFSLEKEECEEIKELKEKCNNTKGGKENEPSKIPAHLDSLAERAVDVQNERVSGMLSDIREKAERAYKFAEESPVPISEYLSLNDIEGFLFVACELAQAYADMEAEERMDTWRPLRKPSFTETERKNMYLINESLQEISDALDTAYEGLRAQAADNFRMGLDAKVASFHKMAELNGAIPEDADNSSVSGEEARIAETMAAIEAADGKLRRFVKENPDAGIQNTDCYLDMARELVSAETKLWCLPETEQERSLGLIKKTLQEILGVLDGIYRERRDWKAGKVHTGLSASVDVFRGATMSLDTAAADNIEDVGNGSIAG